MFDLMTAYRQHFEEANLQAAAICQSGRLGDVRVFHSLIGQQVEEKNVRLTENIEHGGGPLFDMGVYCINAARYLFHDEPIELTAFRARSGEHRFQKAEERVSVILRFPKDRLANFTCSFGIAPEGRYIVSGTKGLLTLDPAYDYAVDKRMRVTTDGSTNERIFPASDHFGPELVYFSNCILDGLDPEPSGEEGLADVQIIRAAYRACETGRAVALEPAKRPTRPEPEQEIHRPPFKEPQLVHARMPSEPQKKK